MGPNKVRAPAGLAAMASLGAAALAGCDVPARPDSWQPTSDPDPAPKSESDSALVDAERSRLGHLEPPEDALAIHLDRQPPHLNPMVSPSVWTMRIAHGPIFEPLLRYGPPAPAAAQPAYRPALAESFEVSADGRAIRLEIREGVRFHDGAEFSIRDAAFSLELARSGRAGARRFRGDFADVTAIERRGDRELVIRLARPNAFALRALAEVPMLPRHVYAGSLVEGPDRVVGTGPYEVARWDEEGVFLASFSDYWDTPPRTDEIEFRYVPDAARALVLARRGGLHVLPELSRRHQREAAEPHGGAELRPLELRPPELSFLALNAQSGALRDAEVRRAISLAIDRSSIIASAYGGDAVPAPGPVWPGGPVHGPPVPPAHHDPSAARRVLDRAGWEVSPDGFRARDDEPLRVSLMAPSGERREVRAQIENDLRAVGILVSTREVGSPVALAENMRRADFDLALARWRGEVDRNPSALLQARFSPDAPELKAAVDARRSARSREGRAGAAGRLAEAFAAAVPWVPLVAPTWRGAVSERVEGVRVWNGWFDLTRLEVTDGEPEGPEVDALGDLLRAHRLLGRLPSERGD